MSLISLVNDFPPMVWVTSAPPSLLVSKIIRPKLTPVVPLMRSVTTVRATVFLEGWFAGVVQTKPGVVASVGVLVKAADKSGVAATTGVTTVWVGDNAIVPLAVVLYQMIQLPVTNLLTESEAIHFPESNL
ncbi:hypothetical protein [Desulfuromonas sp. DDH964]|uniref:hypothetical protein n=1 Tax=Desulfuromonas sp. DDH964 TaxID=1823759 RepID=UPI001E44B0D9|nr:hypothetical protein [Desulfuromonas sp. DDH964]